MKKNRGGWRNGIHAPGPSLKKEKGKESPYLSTLYDSIPLETLPWHEEAVPVLPFSKVTTPGLAGCAFVVVVVVELLLSSLLLLNLRIPRILFLKTLAMVFSF